MSWFAAARRAAGSGSPPEPGGAVAQDLRQRRVLACARPGAQRHDGTLGGVQRVDVRRDLLVLGGELGLAPRLRVLADARGVTGVGRSVDLGAQVGEAAVLLRDLDGELAHLGGRHRVRLKRKQANGLSQQGEAGRGSPPRIGDHGVDETARTGFFVLDLEGAAVVEGPAEDPPVVGADQEALEQDLAERLDVGLVAGEVFRVEIGEEVRDGVAAVPHGGHAVRPQSVLDAAAVVGARVGLRRLDRSVFAEPADGLKRPLRRFLDLGDPAPQRGGVGQIGSLPASRPVRRPRPRSRRPRAR